MFYLLSSLYAEFNISQSKHFFTSQNRDAKELCVKNKASDSEQFRR